jgi:hypothetical protein
MAILKDLGLTKVAEDEEEEDEEDNKKTESVSKAAMDSALEQNTALTIKKMQGVIAASDDIRAAGFGSLKIACDSAEGVYGEALKTMGVDTKNIHPSAFKSLFHAHNKAKSNHKIAQDGAIDDDFATKWSD